jgi:hypothetical protein
MSRKSTFVLLLAAAITTLTLFGACRNQQEPFPAAAGPAGELEQYAATVARIIEDGKGREEEVTRVARSGEKSREEWTEGGEARALIWRPDLGKSFLLFPGRRLYVETDIHQGADPGAVDPDAVDRAMDSAPLPVSAETRMLPDQIINNYLCQVVQKRAEFADGHAEVTTTYRARALGGLAVRVETETLGDQRIKVITERRDIRLEVAPEEFIIPPDFRKVDRIP